MSRDLIFIPVLVQVMLTIVLYLALSAVKKREAEQGNVNEARRGLYDDAWPESVRKINNCIRNQFEVPVLFYVLAFMLWALNAVDMVALAVAGLFAASRMVHAYIHTGVNDVPTRRKVFTVGCVLVIAMLVLAIKALILG